MIRPLKRTGRLRYSSWPRLRNPLTIILLAASALSPQAGDVPSFVVIACMVLLSTFDFVQEMRAQNSVDDLWRSVAVRAIHDLGVMDMLCTDKTGTLTEAQDQSLSDFVGTA